MSEQKYRHRKPVDGESVPQHIYAMENILDQAIQKLEAYYTSRQWKEDYAMDEEGKLPENLKRGVLSQDGIWNLLERNKELIRRIGISVKEDNEDLP